MSEHVTETCNEGSGLWLPLTEYSVRSGISTSTIRRKIKSNTIRYRLENGRYLILYAASSDEAKEPTATSPVSPMQVTEPLRPRKPSPKVRAKHVEATVSHEGSVAVPIMEKAVHLVSDAFEHSLHDKDERIRLLECQNKELHERLDELRTLVQVLEEKYQVRY